MYSFGFYQLGFPRGKIIDRVRSMGLLRSLHSLAMTAITRFTGNDRTPQILPLLATIFFAFFIHGLCVPCFGEDEKQDEKKDDKESKEDKDKKKEDENKSQEQKDREKALNDIFGVDQNAKDAQTQMVDKLSSLEKQLNQLNAKDFAKAKEEILKQLSDNQANLKTSEQKVMAAILAGRLERIESDKGVRSAQVKVDVGNLNTLISKNKNLAAFDLEGGRKPQQAGKATAAELVNNALFLTAGIASGSANGGKGIGHTEAITDIPKNSNVAVVDLSKIFGDSDKARQQIIDPIRGLMNQNGTLTPITAETLLNHLQKDENYKGMALLGANKISEFLTSIGSSQSMKELLNGAEKMSIKFGQSGVSTGQRDLFKMEIKDSQGNVRGTLFWSVEFTKDTKFTNNPGLAGKDASAFDRVSAGAGSELIFIPKVGDNGRSGGNGAPAFFAFGTKNSNPFQFAGFIDSGVANDKNAIASNAKEVNKNISINTFNTQGCIRCHAPSTRGDTQSITLSETLLSKSDITFPGGNTNQWQNLDQWKKTIANSASNQNNFAGSVTPLTSQKNTYDVIYSYLKVINKK